nr:MAG TPA: hypothetical protein [Caudoviricetes sp.]
MCWNNLESRNCEYLSITRKLYLNFLKFQVFFIKIFFSSSYLSNFIKFSSQSVVI